MAQGPSPMALGRFAFRALGPSFESQSRGLETPWAELEVCYRQDALQWTGPKSDSFTIEGVIFEEAFGGQDTIDGLREAAESGTPLMLVTHDGRVFGRHVILSINENRGAIRGDGLARRNEYQIELKRLTASGFAGVVGGLRGLF